MELETVKLTPPPHHARKRAAWGEDGVDVKYDFDHGEDNDAGDRDDDAGEDLSEDLQQGVPPVAGIGVVK